MESVPLTDEAAQWALLDLLSRTSPSQPLVWLRNGEGFVGAGRVLRLAFRGTSRFRDAARAWQTYVENAEVDDRVGQPGSGLIGFGTFAFDEASPTESVLLIPEVVFGQRDGVAWVTRVTDVVTLPEALELEGELDVTFEPGALSELAFTRAVKDARRKIRAGELEKVVIARDMTATLPQHSDLRLVVSHLAQVYADCWTFAVDGMIGASPETLISVEQEAISGRILAGTAPRNQAVAADTTVRAELEASEKDRAEHNFAVESVMAELEPLTVQLSVSPEPFVLELPNVWHLATDFSGALTEHANVLDVVAALHPTAAVAGTPTDVAVTLIEKLEPFDRGRYAGPIGWLDANGNGEWGIALRCAQVRTDRDGVTRVTAYAGGGIVAESNPEDELAETALKFQPIIGAFNGLA